MFVKKLVLLPLYAATVHRVEICFDVFGRPGSDLLSRVLRRSTISAGAFHGRVRNGIGCSRSAITTRSAKHIKEKLSFCLVTFSRRSAISITGEARKANRPSALVRRARAGPMARERFQDGYK